MNFVYCVLEWHAISYLIFIESYILNWYYFFFMQHPYSINIYQLVPNKKTNMSFGVKLVILFAKLGVIFWLYWNICLISIYFKIVKKRFLWAGDFFLIKNAVVKCLIEKHLIIWCLWDLVVQISSCKHNFSLEIIW